ncbi:hypothetical protein TNCV_3668741 [Trichonephila clavipes]|nr:hypothetical protein TNCV_3668741 [Trichonephila clavipes]
MFSRGQRRTANYLESRRRTKSRSNRYDHEKKCGSGRTRHDGRRKRPQREICGFKIQRDILSPMLNCCRQQSLTSYSWMIMRRHVTLSAIDNHEGIQRVSWLRTPLIYID